MNNEQRRRALRRRRRRRQIIRRRILLLGIAAAFIALIAAFVSLASSRGRIEASETPKVATVDIVEAVAEAEAETTGAQPEPTTEAQLIKSLDYGTEDAYMLAKMAMAEAESEDTEGKALVILVILNRVWADQFPDSIAGVISEENAFTSYSNGRYDRVEPDEDCWAALALVESHWDESQGALYFERTPAAGESTWHSRNLEKLFIHGNHTFYREKEAAGE